MDSESTSLIRKKDNSLSQETPVWRKYVPIIPAVFFLFLGVFSDTYVGSEWVQYKVKKDNFPELGVKNKTACGVMNHSDPTYQNYTIVQQTSAHWMMYFSIAHHVPTFFMNLILNGYTDTYGRKFVFVLSSFGLCVKLVGVSIIIYLDASLNYTVVMCAIDGLLGSKYAIFAALFAYIADITKTENHRVLGVVCMEIVFVIVTILSSYLSGLLIETWQLGFFHTSLFSMSSGLLGFIIFIFLVPESLDTDKRRSAQHILGTLKMLIQFYVGESFKGKRAAYTLLLLAFACAELSGICRNSIEILYFLGQPFCWGPSKISTFMMTRHAVFGVVGIVSLKLFQRFLKNEVIACLSNISNAVSFIIEGVAVTNLMIYMVPVAGIFSFLTIPMIRGIMSVITDPDKQGAMFSSVAAIEVLSILVGTMAENEIYAKTYSFMNGFVFIIMGAFCIIDAALLFSLYILRRRQSYKENAHPSVLINSEIS